MRQTAEIAAVLSQAREILIACHVNPDGDCLGSSLALAFALERRGRRVTVASADGVPEMYRFLPDSDRVVRSVDGRTFDAAVGMDCSDLSRLGALAPAMASARTIINIDHHLGNSGYGHLRLWDTRVSAVGELVYELIEALGEEVDEAMAACLLTAIVTDTGAFRYPNVTPHTLRLSALLMEKGPSPAEIIDHVYETRSPGAVRLLGMVLSRLVLTDGGAIAYASVTREMFRAAGAVPEDTAGIIAFLRSIRGVKVALLFEEGPTELRGSVRARGGARANVIAEALGGGGHAGAAGFSATGPLEEVIQQALERTRRELAEHVSAQALSVQD
ncbi:MAG: bifunctional oligoribonuclease/PAP phosphatase NrnA [Armatimonadetes bacterium]|nr:bifunctional oligoribonuclease/PAP phosphatase NrnA [Armatimonadota bacterium]